MSQREPNHSAELADGASRGRCIVQHNNGEAVRECVTHAECVEFAHELHGTPNWTPDPDCD